MQNNACRIRQRRERPDESHRRHIPIGEHRTSLETRSSARNDRRDPLLFVLGQNAVNAWSPAKRWSTRIRGTDPCQDAQLF